MDAFLITILSLLPIVVLSVVVYGLIKKNKTKQHGADWSKVGKTFDSLAFATKELHGQRDNIDHCPQCGSHDIKIYREGYNYSKGFWLRMFDVKGGGYVAGMNSNRARCRCMNCGNDWATDYDYRLIDKK